MKKIFLTFLLLTLVPLASAANLNVEKIDKGSVLIVELDNPAVYDFVITNHDQQDDYEIYSLVGLSFSPKGTFSLLPGKNTLEVKVYPNKELRSKPGFYTIEYQMKGQNTGIFKDTITFKVVHLKDAIDIRAEDVHISNRRATVLVRNIQNTFLEYFSIRLSSVFFDTTKTLTLGPHEEVNLSIPLDAEKMKSIVAGPYVVTADVELANVKVQFEAPVRYLEKSDIAEEKTTSGFIIRTTAITKKNTGNVPVTAHIDLNKDIISRLFTVHSLEPLHAQREGLIVSYSWEKDLKPGESFTLTTTTNYTFPVLLLILVIVIAVLVHIMLQTSLIVTKRVFYVKTRGGEFALKVRLRVKAKRSVQQIQLIDKLPGTAQIYEKFGIKPDRIDTATRRLFWNVGTLDSGEERVYSYIIYSKVNIVGRFELPAATALFHSNGQKHEVFSNRAFFISDTVRE